MARYSDEARAEAVALLQAEGYPDRKGALSTISSQLGIPHTTLRRWFNETSNPPPNKIVQEKRRDLADLFRDEIYAILGVIPGKRDEAGYRELITAMGIMFDKLRLIQGESTENVKFTPIAVVKMDVDEL